MSELEIKGRILQLVSSINDRNTLVELKDLISNFMGHHIADTDFWDEISEFEKEELNKAIEESEDENNHVSHSEVMKKYSKWLEK